MNYKSMYNKRNRQDKIIELVQTNIIRTQEQLRNMLMRFGFDDVTQVKVSRDLLALNIAKVPCVEGGRKYALLSSVTSYVEADDLMFLKKLKGIFKE